MSNSGGNQNTNFQLGLLHFAYLLITADGAIDEREKTALQKIKADEKISDKIFEFFNETVTSRQERDIYDEGVELLNKCTEEERLTAFVHLYQLVNSDQAIHEKEVRLLLYSLKATNISFEDVKLTARMSMLKR
jgi:uncharacterized tellurite resistance protein B-like protein